MFSTVYGREKRNKNNLFHPLQNQFVNYCTETIQKTEMRHDFDENLFSNLHLIPDPLKKNLADQLISTEMPEKHRKTSENCIKIPENCIKIPENCINMSENCLKMSENCDKMTENNPDVQSSTLAGITSFFSGVFNMLSSAVFRSRSPVYYDCFDGEGSPNNWQPANTSYQDKNGSAPDSLLNDIDMNTHFKTAASCEAKLSQVRGLLTPSNPVWVRKRPKKVFVDPNSVEESFEDAFCPEEFVSLPNDSYIEYCSPYQYHIDELYQTDAPKTKVEYQVNEKTNIVQDVQKDIVDPSKLNLEHEFDLNLEPEKINLESESNLEKKLNMELDLNKEHTNIESNNVTDVSPTATESNEIKHEIISTCEDKLAKLKALLQEKRKKKPTIETESKPVNKSTDKRFKNPHRSLDKRKKAKLKQNIQEDMLFANEIDLEPHEDYFNEVTGKFQTSDNESFQIVFNDRVRIPSECDSEDSFIVFEESPDSCYTSNDVFGEIDSGSDSDTDLSDSGCSTLTCKLSPSLSRTVSNLTDDSLYVESGDEIDCAVVEPLKEVKTGLLLDDERKKDRPVKKVHFSNEPPKVHLMRVWAFAARQARAGHWERYAVDRERFKRRIADTDMAVSWVLKPQHRARVMFQRFMPWWNAEKRREAAEKKEKERREEEERVNRENEERLANEEKGDEIGEVGEIEAIEEVGEIDDKSNLTQENEIIKDGKTKNVLKNEINEIGQESHKQDIVNNNECNNVNNKIDFDKTIESDS